MAGRKRKKFNVFLIIILFIYLAALFYSLIFSRSVQFEYIQYNLTPFTEINRYIQGRNLATELSIINLLGNIVVFMPFGILVPMISQKERRSYMIFLLTVELSLVIEVIQLFTRRGSFDVDDLLLNTVGGLLGYAVYKVIRNIGKSISS